MRFFRRTKELPTTTGRRAEEEALAFLQKQGLRLIERNYRCRGGEIDLIMEDAHSLVFVEVRYRADTRFGTALESVAGRKQARLITAAGHFFANRRPNCPSRFDVVAISPMDADEKICWVKDAFRCD